jgi:hypothetical protein
MHPKCTLGSGGGAPAVAGSPMEPGARLDLMSSANAANEWELVVPDDDAALVAEFRRHGIKPGQRVHVALVEGAEASADAAAVPSFFSSFDGPPDLAARSGEILRAELPGGR